jgi:hypothetical protein
MFRCGGEKIMGRVLACAMRRLISIACNIDPEGGDPGGESPRVLSG